ncbi:hypothetical protein [Endozoicomonas euniceicola]|uniref:Tetratricopeptide repeat protein n=1 Tax=Endozoicomonas euniceicola TaxID=1234143 RepID=A0ABY6GS43_9GAMM|nr:hypothetical protein [Endozoicomonas euniceicola]UYM15578.1 hypothetical protein NX720_22490 [Endozoicomonas euniceicola]
MACNVRDSALCVKLANKVLEYPDTETDTDSSYGTHGTAYTSMAIGLTRLERFEESIIAADNALKFPDIGNIHRSAWESKSVSLAHLRQFEQCRVAAENSIQHEDGSTSFVARLYKVICLYGEGAFDQCIDAADAFDSKLLSAPLIYDSLQLYKGYCLYEKGMWHEARERAQWLLNRQTDVDAVINANQLKKLLDSHIYPFTTSFLPSL